MTLSDKLSRLPPMTYRRLGGRASAILFAKRNEIERSVNAMIAEHSAKGCLQSGATIKKALRIFEEKTADALGQILGELAKLVEHRGRKWDSALAGIHAALDGHIKDARRILDRPLKCGGATSDTAASKAVDEFLAQVEQRLRGQISEFGEGWTAPQPKAWHERRPNWNRFLFILAGAIVTALVGKAFGLLG